MNRTLVMAGVCLLAVTAVSAADATTNSQKLAFVIPDLYGQSGLTLQNPTHMAHFDSDFQANFVPFNGAIASQLTSLPIPSPASGFTYSFDKSLGVYSRSAQSFGPVLAERAETIGKGKLLVGFAYQRFKFDKIDGLDLNKIPALFQHIPNPANPQFAKDIITTSNSVDLNLGQYTTFVTYGIADRLDVSVAIPLETASLGVSSDATIHRIGTFADPTIHSFGTSGDGSRALFTSAASATGFGDIVIRAKGTVYSWGSGALAAGLDVRVPTGDEYNFLGSGAYGVKPFVAASMRYKKVAPHINLGYQYNGQSVLAGNVTTATKSRLPAQYLYAAGADIGLTEKFTLAVDILGQEQTGAQRVVKSLFTAADSNQYQEIKFRSGSVNETNGAIGFKLNPYGRFLVSFNLLFNLNQGGLRARVVPLIGVSYTM